MFSSIASRLLDSINWFSSPTPAPVAPSLFATYAPFVALATLTVAFVWSVKQVIQIRRDSKAAFKEDQKLLDAIKESDEAEKTAATQQTQRIANLTNAAADFKAAKQKLLDTDPYFAIRSVWTSRPPLMDEETFSELYAQYPYPGETRAPILPPLLTKEQHRLLNS
ncbi:MAG TPA: hypothetical protein VLE89_00075 [Chlamydiales bacterium]|nr:hypothetical protein [Chlamydiales bacterium]